MFRDRLMGLLRISVQCCDHAQVMGFGEELLPSQLVALL